jgi:hypothetical protein
MLRGIQPTSHLKDAGPDDYGHRTRNCPSCGAWLCRYNAGPLCWPCSPGGEGGVILEVAPGEWRRFQLADSRVLVG